MVAQVRNSTRFFKALGLLLLAGLLASLLFWEKMPQFSPTSDEKNSMPLQWSSGQGDDKSPSSSATQKIQLGHLEIQTSRPWVSVPVDMPKEYGRVLVLSELTAESQQGVQLQPALSIVRIKGVPPIQSPIEQQKYSNEFYLKKKKRVDLDPTARWIRSNRAKELKLGQAEGIQLSYFVEKGKEIQRNEFRIISCHNETYFVSSVYYPRIHRERDNRLRIDCKDV